MIHIFHLHLQIHSNKIKYILIYIQTYNISPKKVHHIDATNLNPQIKTSQTIKIYFIEKRGGKKKGTACNTKPFKPLDAQVQEVGDFALSPVHVTAFHSFLYWWSTHFFIRPMPEKGSKGNNTYSLYYLFYVLFRESSAILAVGSLHFIIRI